ncbi:MAG TPA: sialidase family protein [Solirubrobacteraceae bacterium]|nr:sialidase family protein [Solirubrobacteraceae bacterium]
MRRVVVVVVALIIAGVAAAVAVAASPGADVRLTNDEPGTGGYTSDYTLVTGQPYTDATLSECSQSRGRQNEPAVVIDPRNSQVIVGSSNDYCGVYNASSGGIPQATGPIWLGYYRSETGGSSFQSSLVPGYPGDTSPYAARAQIRTASAGDPVLAWDNAGRLYAGSESSDDPAGTKKTFGDEWVATYENPGGPTGSTSNDGKEFKRSVIVAKGSSAPNLLGNFNDKTAIEADRTSSVCQGDVYFSWSRYSGNGGNSIYFSRSTDHGATFSKPLNLGPSNAELQFPDIAVTGNGHVYVTFRRIANAKKNVADAVMITKSTDCGKTFSAPKVVETFTRYDATDVPDPVTPTAPSTALDDPFSDENTDASGGARDCGSLADHCASNYTFFRRDTQVRSTADQNNASSENVYIVYDPSKPGTEVTTGTTYGSEGSGTGSQSGVYFVRYNGATGGATAPKLIDNEPVGHQLFPDIAVDGGVLHALWWDSRNDPAYSPARPVGNEADGTVVPSLDVFAATSTNGGGSWTTAARITDVTTNPNYEQFDNRQVPFAGDYLWIDAQHGQTFGTWTDWRNTVAGSDPREPASDATGGDVDQCRTLQSDGSWGPDTCPRDGGLDQNIYGDHTP